MNVWQICLALLLTAVARAEWRVTPLAELEHIPIAAGFTEKSAQLVCAESIASDVYYGLQEGGAEGETSTITCADLSQVRILTIPFGRRGDLSPMGSCFLLILDKPWVYSTENGKYQTVERFIYDHAWSADDRWLALAEHGGAGSNIEQFSVIESSTGRRTIVGTSETVSNVRFQSADSLVVNDMIWRRNAEGEWKNQGKVALLAGIRGHYGAGSRFVFAGKGLSFVDLAKGTRREVHDGLGWGFYRGAYEADGGGTVALLFGARREEAHIDRVSIWDVKTLRERTFFELVQPNVRQKGVFTPFIAFSPDGSLIAVDGQDKLWNTADGSVAVQLPGRAVISGATSFGHGNRLVVHNEGEKAKLIKIEKVEEP